MSIPSRTVSTRFGYLDFASLKQTVTDDTPKSPRATNTGFDTFEIISDMCQGKESKWPHRRVNTKFMCTMGPAVLDEGKMKQLLLSGMRIARFNFSHGTAQDRLKALELLRKAEKETGIHCATLCDTHGAEIRTGKVEGGKALLKEGENFTIYVNYMIGNEKGVCLRDFWEFPKFVQPGDILRLDYGLVSLKVTAVKKFSVETVIENSGPLGDHKIITVLGQKGSINDRPFLAYKDTIDIDFAIRNNFDFIAASYVQRKEDIAELRELPGVAESGIAIVSKIESQLAFDNLDEIISVSDGIYLTRSDIAVEVPIWRICEVQKEIAKKCNQAGVACFLGSQVLTSMVRNPRPTRAECTDVANAIYEGYDGLCLTTCTAIGKYPIEALEQLTKIAVEVEKEQKSYDVYIKMRQHVLRTSMVVSTTETVASSIVKSAWDLNATLILVLSSKEQNSGYIAKYRPHCPVICVADAKTARRVLQHRCCSGRAVANVGEQIASGNTEAIIKETVEDAKKQGLVKVGERVIVASGKEELSHYVVRVVE